MKRVNGKETLIFIHLPKAAGTTLAHLIEAEFGDGEVYVTNLAEREAGFATLPETEKRQTRLLTGHMGFGLHQTLPQEAVYVTLLRHPVKRVVSHYYFEQREPASSLRGVMAAGMTLAEYVVHQHAYKRDNLQTRVLAGDWVNRHGTRLCDEAMLTQAKHNLRRYFAVVGLTEQFALSYCLMANVFGWRPRLSVRHNRMGGGGKGVPAGDLAIITEHNQYDLALYAFAENLLAEQVAQMPAQFQRQVKWYQLRTMLNNGYWTLRRYSVRAYLKKHWGVSVQE